MKRFGFHNAVEDAPRGLLGGFRAEGFRLRV